jgi:Fungal potassium channel
VSIEKWADQNGNVKSFKTINSTISMLNHSLPTEYYYGPDMFGYISTFSNPQRSTSSTLKQVSSYTVPLLMIAIFLLAFNKWATQVKPAVSLSISRWIFSGCIIFSFLLLAKDWWTARKIIRSKDISFAYTNLIGTFCVRILLTVANRWYCVHGGYAYYCLFDRLGDSRHAWVSIAFFVFFSFKGIKSSKSCLI